MTIHVHVHVHSLWIHVHVFALLCSWQEDCSGCGGGQPGWGQGAGESEPRDSCLISVMWCALIVVVVTRTVHLWIDVMKYGSNMPWLILHIMPTCVLITHTHTHTRTHTHTHTHTQCEQMEVELHDVSAGVRPALKGRLESYRKELARIRKEFVSDVCTCTVCTNKIREGVVRDACAV